MGGEKDAGVEAEVVAADKAKFTIAPQGLTPEFIARAVEVSHKMNEVFSDPKWLPPRAACDPRLDDLQATVDAGDPDAIEELVRATGVCFQGVFLDHVAALRKKAHPDRTKLPSASEHE